MLERSVDNICVKIVKHILDSVPETDRRAKAIELAGAAGIEPQQADEFAEHVLGYPSYKSR